MKDKILKIGVIIIALEGGGAPRLSSLTSRFPDAISLVLEGM